VISDDCWPRRARIWWSRASTTPPTRRSPKIAWSRGARAGSEVDHLVFITLGTGVITHGVLLRGAQGAGGELGHVTLDPTSIRWSPGPPGHGPALCTCPGPLRGRIRRPRELHVRR
jgi:ROK family